MSIRGVAHTLGVATIAYLSFTATTASARTYEVGAGKANATIQDVLEQLQPGDIVEVQGDATYPGDIWFRTSGTADAPITIRGIKVNGRRPVIEGIGTEQWHDMIVLFYASHLVFEGFEIVGDGNTEASGIVNKGDQIVIRDVVVHGVGGQGLMGTDAESGSLTLERSEFYDNGFETYNHQIYMATDETMFPGSVFRMQDCYVHDGAGGNNVKSRAERNEIYYNWIEGAFYHELDLIGPDGQDENLAREDSDVVGNVFVKHSEWRIARIGGDGTGNTAGRYRFVNNTMVLGATSDVALGLQETVESVELHNNVIIRLGEAGGQLWNHNEASGAAPQIFGSNNWIQDGITAVPDTLTGTLSGSDPGFQNSAEADFRPTEDSPLVDAGNASPTPSGPALASPQTLPTRVPPSRALGTEAERTMVGAPDIGAFELGVGTEPGPSGVTETGGRGQTETGDGDGTSAGSANAEASESKDDGGCGCRITSSNPARMRLALPALLLAFGWSRRRGRRALTR